MLPGWIKTEQLEKMNVFADAKTEKASKIFEFIGFSVHFFRFVDFFLYSPWFGKGFAWIGLPFFAYRKHHV